jgi:DNA-binding GntR family transcriptional regulator
MTSPAPIPRLHRSTLGEDVYETVKALVMDHTLAPGERINIDALARDLDVSSTPVREALARLESDGLVRKRPLAGYTVSPLLSRDEFNDLFDIRLVLEGAAARWAALRAAEDARDVIVAEAAVSMAIGGRDRDGYRSHAEFTARDARFHELVAVSAGNELLRESIGRLHAHLHIHRLYFPYAQVATTGREHQRVAAAVRAPDPDAAEAAMRAHIDAARARHLPAFDL